jgi:hypothetical protein
MKDRLLEYLCSQVDSPIDVGQMMVISEVITEEEAKEIIERDFPFLIEMPLLRNRVEDVLFNRLTQLRDDDLEVTQSDFDARYRQLEGLIRSIAMQRLVTGFTSDDLESFMLLKLHQTMRRNLYDPEKAKKMRSFYSVTFNNLINDLNRCKNRAIDKCDSDGMYDRLNIDTTPGMPFI